MSESGRPPERSAHDPCLRNVGCIFTRNHSGYCSTFSPSSVPVPRPSEGQIEIKSCPFCGAVPTIRKVFALETVPERIGIEHPENWQCVLTGEHFNLAEWNRRSPSVPTATQVSQRERANAFAEILHELIRPDNGKCNQCGAEWSYRLDGSWEYIDGEHFPHCIARRVIERRAGEIRLSAFVAELHANAPAASSEEAANSDTPQTTQGPKDTDEAKRQRLPHVLKAYADAIERQRVFVIDSDFLPILRRAVAALEGQ